MKSLTTDLLIGVAVGDALGVPFEFLPRKRMADNPAKGMTEYGTHHQPMGTWSDDSSLTFCLAEALIEGYSLEKASEKFIKWKNEAYWTAHHRVFDIGITTSRSISLLHRILDNREYDRLNTLKYDSDEYDNGNGSLMRILPLLVEIKGKDLKTQFDIVWSNSSLTHRHIRAGMSCMIYLKMAEYLSEGNDKVTAYEHTRRDILKLWELINFYESEQKHFIRVIQNDIREAEKETIMSGGYVIESLEASFWSLLTTDTFEDAVLTAINFGHDTDTTGAITGGIAGICYTQENIPEFWKASLARMEDILDLAERLSKKYQL